MEKNTIIDLSDGGPVIDVSPEGYADFESSLTALLSRICTEFPSIAKRQKVRVCASLIVYRGETIERIEVPRIYTAGYLFRHYKKWFDKEFELKRHIEQDERKWSIYEKRAEGRAAWGMYSNLMHTHKVIQENERIEGLPKKEREAAKKKLSDGCIMFIG